MIPAEPQTLEFEDTYPETPKPFRLVRILTNIFGSGPGVGERLVVKTGPRHTNTVQLGIPQADGSGYVTTVVPYEYLRAALDKVQAFEPVD